MTERLADLAISALVLVAVVILGVADVVPGEVVATIIGAVLPSPVRAVTTRVRPQITPRSP